MLKPYTIFGCSFYFDLKGLPTKFCKDHLPPSELKMVLEDQNGTEYDAVYIGSRTGLSGGWRGFALEQGLDEGDALVFELIKPARFKVASNFTLDTFFIIH